jgi:insertion element IS1 protein InsB
VRDIVRVLRVSSATVIDVLKKKEPAVKQVNERLLHTLDPPQVDVILRQVDAAEMDEMWSFVGSKSQQRWLWHAIDHHTGQILAYVFGTREDETFLQLKELLAPFGITHFYTDGWGAYRRHLDPRTHTVGKQHTQKIERKHITFRTRIKRLTRKTICFSRSILMHPTLSRCKTRKNPLPSAEYSTRRLYAIQERGADGIASCRTLGSFRPYCLCYQELTSD